MLAHRSPLRVLFLSSLGILGGATALLACLGREVAGGSTADDGGTAGETDSSTPNGNPPPTEDDAGTDLDASSAEDADAAPPPVKRIFVTNGVHKGNFGGVSGVDDFCQAAAGAAGAGGQFMAFVSTANANAIDRLTYGGPWHSMDGQTLLFTGKTTGQHPIAGLGPAAPINQNEFAQTLPGNQNTFYWTGSNPGGVTKADAHCNNWTDENVSPFASGSTGSVDSADAKWVSYTNYVCYSPNHVLCFEK